MDPIFRQISFTLSVMGDTGYPYDDLPEIAIAGRSNVGKSSLLNALGGNRKLARTSKQPGRTQAVNVFALGDRARLLDLPGYGYAKVSRSVSKDWRKLIESAFKRPNLCGVITLMDIRHPLTDSDQIMLDFAANLDCPVLPVLTKADKFSRGAGLNIAHKVAKQLGREKALTVSSSSGAGVEALQTQILEWLSAAESACPD